MTLIFFLYFDFVEFRWPFQVYYQVYYFKSFFLHIDHRSSVHRLCISKSNFMKSENWSHSVPRRYCTGTVLKASDTSEFQNELHVLIDCRHRCAKVEENVFHF